ncbi:Serine acetyltransferase [compost metagenome]
MIGSGAKVLGSFKIGDQANIGANSVVLKEVPAGSTVVGIPGKVVRLDGKRLDRLSHQLPDPVVDAMREMQREIEQLRSEIRDLKQSQHDEQTTEITNL